MRLARPLLVALFLLLALAPAASAHDESEPEPPRHAGRPRGRGHQPHARRRAPGAHGRARPAAVPADDVVRHRSLTTDDTAHAAFPASAAPDQGRLRPRAATSRTTSALWRTRCRPTSRASSSSWPLQTGGRRALRFDMGTECGPQYVDIQVVAPARDRAPTSPATTTSNFTPWPTTSRPPSARHGPARRVRPGRQAHRRPDPATTRVNGVWGIAQVIDDDTAGAGNDANAGGLTAMMLDRRVDARPTRGTGSRR